MLTVRVMEMTKNRTCVRARAKSRSEAPKTTKFDITWMGSTKPRHPKTCLVSFWVTKSLYWTLYSLTRSGTAFSDSWLLMWWKHTHLYLWFLQPETCSFFRISFFWAKRLMLLIGISKCSYKSTSPLVVSSRSDGLALPTPLSSPKGDKGGKREERWRR